MALTVNRRFTAVLGPVKKEFVFLTSDGTNDDPVSTLLQNPSYVSVTPVNADQGGTADGASATLSGKTATTRDLTNARVYQVEFTGF